jgi:hypothetical protein
MNLYALLLYFLVAMNCPNGLHGPDCSACLISVIDCLFFTNLSPKMVDNRCLQRAKSRPSDQMGRPAGRTPLPKQTGLSMRNLMPAARRKRTDFDNSEHQNGSAHWRCSEARVWSQVASRQAVGRRRRPWRGAGRKATAPCWTAVDELLVRGALSELLVQGGTRHIMTALSTWLVRPCNLGVRPLTTARWRQLGVISTKGQNIKGS